MTQFPASATALAAAVRSRSRTAADVVQSALADIRKRDPDLNCFICVAEAEALAAAERVDALIAAGGDPGPLAGVPFAVKDLFDVAGEVTRAGSTVRAAAPPADEDAPVVKRLRDAGAVYMGRLNMDEFAYGFATVNSHFGVTRNPHDRARLSGGSSGGSSAATAAGLVPITLGSDTNGSVRVPASLCGVFGLRPTFDAVPTQGVFPFVDFLDTVGVFTRTIEDLRTAFHVVADASPTAAPRSAIRAARLDGWFRRNCEPSALEGLDAIAAHLGAERLIDLPTAAAGRSAAFVLTAKTGGDLHRATLLDNAHAYDPAVRDRLIAGLTLPEAMIQDARAAAERFTSELTDALEDYDILVAPSTPTPAPKISDDQIEIDGRNVSARANLGLYTQPLSLAGVPILSAPLRRSGRLPIGVQLIAARGREALLLQAAEQLVEAGLVCCDAPQADTVEA